MKCFQVRNRLLMTTHPGEPSPSLQPHLDACPACTAFWLGLLKLDEAIPALPVPRPRPDAKARLIAQFDANWGETTIPVATFSMPVVMATPAPIAPTMKPSSPIRKSAKPAVKPIVETSLPPTDLTPPTLAINRHRRDRSRAIMVGSLAAGVLMAIGLVGYFIRQKSPQAPMLAEVASDPFLARVMDRNVALANAETPQRRFDQLAQLADNLLIEGRQLAQVAEVEDIAAIAEMYERVVMEGVVVQAKELPEPDRHLVRRVAGQLVETSKIVEQLTQQVKPSSIESLRSISRTAIAGDKALRALFREEAL